MQHPSATHALARLRSRGGRTFVPARLMALALAAGVAGLAACSGGSGSSSGDGDSGAAGSSGSGGGSGSGSGSGSSSGAGTGSGSGGTGSSSGGAGDAGTPSPDAGGSSGGVFDASIPGDGAAPAGFWDFPGAIPVAKNALMFVFLNRTNGKYQDSEVYWSFKSGTISETHSIAQQPTYDMPANASGRMYFYVCGATDTTCASDPTKSKYYDFIEFTIGATQFNGNTTRVDAFGLKIAQRLHCADGFDVAVGESYATFAEDRAATFQAFVDAVPAEFKPLAQAPNAPYRIVQPGAGGFDMGGAHASYYDTFVDALWAANGLTIAKPGPNGSGLGSYPDVSAAINRHVGAVAGTFDASGKLLDKTLWQNSATFYTAAPADYYAAFWHARALDGKAYGFPYDDVGGYSSYVSHANPQTLKIAIGW